MPLSSNATPSASPQSPPVILAFGAMDPSGSGGIQADIETAASLGCHCAPVATALCTSVGPDPETATIAIDHTLVIEQARSVLEDMAVSAIKIGFTGSVANVEAIHSILRDYPHIPVALHPSLALWDREDADQSGLLAALAELLLPLATTIHLDMSEIRELAPEADTLDASAQAILSRGCEYLLVCGTGRAGEGTGEKERFQNSLYETQGLVRQYQWEHTVANNHSTASTLTSSVAAYLGHNSHPVAAIEQGQNFTWQALVAARQLGSGAPTPYRFFWADAEATAPGEPPADKSTH
jgi:hydroxymethylpyrimidine/phosphomethylpyrimidine kinase